MEQPTQPGDDGLRSVGEDATLREATLRDASLRDASLAILGSASGRVAVPGAGGERLSALTLDGGGRILTSDRERAA